MAFFGVPQIQNLQAMLQHIPANPAPDWQQRFANVFGLGPPQPGQINAGQGVNPMDYFGQAIPGQPQPGPPMGGPPTQAPEPLYPELSWLSQLLSGQTG